MWGCLPIHLGHLEGTCNPIDCVLIDSSPGFKMFEVNGLESLNVLCCANRINYESLGPKYHGAYLGQPFFFSKKRPMKTSWNPKCAQGLQGAPNGWLLPFQTCTKWQGSLGVKHVIQKQWRVSLR